MTLPSSPLRVLWPSFLVSIAACGVFFSKVDPVDLAFLCGFGDVSPIAVYSIGFLAFWLVGALSSILMLVLVRSSDEVNGSHSFAKHRRSS